MDVRTIWTIPIVLILATGLPTALAAHTHSHTQTHSPAYLYGFGPAGILFGGSYEKQPGEDEREKIR